MKQSVCVPFDAFFTALGILLFTKLATQHRFIKIDCKECAKALWKLISHVSRRKPLSFLIMILSASNNVIEGA